MKIKTLLLLVGCFLLLPSMANAQFMTAISTEEAPVLTPEVLAMALAESTDSFSVVLGSASTEINTVGAVNTDPRQIGVFQGGNTAEGTFLPLENQNAAGLATYEGGIGIDSGICISTGLLSDSEENSDDGRGVGIEGPNNGIGSTFNAGEVSFSFEVFTGTGFFTPSDFDFVENVLRAGGGDAGVLEFQIELNKPGFLRLSHVYATDEFPFFSLAEFNDSFGVLIRQDSIPEAEFKNIVQLRTPGLPPEPFTLEALQRCSLFLENQIAPAPATLLGSSHAIDDPTTPFYDHEFAGFSAVMTSETDSALAPGVYTIKIVIQDVIDTLIDSAVFLEADSLKLFDLENGDFNADGVVDVLGDVSILSTNFGMTSASFADGDANGDGVVDGSDVAIVIANLGATGNADFSADFNRDGMVTFQGDVGTIANNIGLTSCASRADGDADRDGDVDLADVSIFIEQLNFGR